jgi:Protein of unknown function (DUF2894)
MNAVADHPAPTSTQAPDALEGLVLAFLAQRGAAQIDPVRLRYLQALAQRAQHQQGRVQELLQAKVVQGLGALSARLAQAQSDAEQAWQRLVAQDAPAAAALRPRLQAGDFLGVQRAAATWRQPSPRATLSALTRELDQQHPSPIDGGVDGNLGLRPELKTMRHFRNTWSKLSVDQQVARALNLAPKNAGPINSHMLVLRSLAAMRDLSPDYLNRFLSYADALLTLDQGDKDKPASTKKADAAPAKKPKARHTRTR